MPPFQIGQRPLGTPRSAAPPMQRTPPISQNPQSAQLPPGFGTALGVPRPPPIDPILDAQRGQNASNETATLAGLDQQQADALRGFGLDDPSDPFSRARLLQETYQRNQRSTLNGMAARGQLYSGAEQNAEDFNSHNYQIGYDQLRKNQNAVLDQIEERRRAAKSNRNQSDINALGDSTQRAANTPVDPSTVPPPIVPPRGLFGLAQPGTRPLKKKK